MRNIVPLNFPKPSLFPRRHYGGGQLLFGFCNIVRDCVVLATRSWVEEASVNRAGRNAGIWWSPNAALYAKDSGWACSFSSETFYAL